MAGPETCYETLAGVDVVMRAHLSEGQHYYVLGGIASAAYTDPETQIDHDERQVLAGPNADLPVVRDNGTQRDIDILIGGVCDDGQIAEATHAVEEVIGGKLLVSMFGFDEHRPFESMTARERVAQTAKAWISRRTVDEAGILRYTLFPLSVEVPHASYDPWQLVTPEGHAVSVLHPVGHVLAYQMRSISGVRPKDEAKVAAMTDAVLSDERFQEAADGTFASWRMFANVLARASRGEIDPANPILPDGVTRAELAAFRWKGKALRFFEGNEKIVQVAQTELGQKLLGGFVGTR